jgi:CHAT domain-containing protein
MPRPGRSVRVTVVLGILICIGSGCRDTTVAPSGRAALAGAVADTLPFQARISGGFVPSKRGPTRAAGDRAPDLSPDARIAIALLEKRAIESPTPEAQADLGVGYLIQGDIDRAITTIEDAASQMTAAAPWSDLSAAYLAKAERTPARRVEYLSRALEAAEKSLKIANTNDALFNRALARDGLAPFTGAPAPWSEYAAVERDQAWRDAATQEANNDRLIDDVRNQWDSRRKELLARLDAGDVAYVEETTRLYPEAMIEFLEENLFTNENALLHSATVADAIHEVTRDPMMRDEVAAWRKHGAALTRAHVLYAQGRRHFAADQIAAARRSFSLALNAFTTLGTPYRLWSHAQLAGLDWFDGRFDDAHVRLTRVEREGRARGYTSVLARALEVHGQVFNKQWRLTEGLQAFRESAAQHEAAARYESAVSLYSSIADAMRMLGEPNESWAYIGRTLDNLNRVRRPIRRYGLLYNASLFAARQQLNEAALLFQEAAVREAGAANPGALSEARVQLGLAYLRRGEDNKTRQLLDQASQQAATMPEGRVKSYLTAEIDIVRAQLANGASIAPLQRAIDYFDRTEPGRVPGLYLLMARTPHARQSQETAERALRAGIDNLEKQQADLGDETLRISFFDESWSLFPEMVSLQLARNDEATAFEYAERSRARSLLAATHGSAASRTRTLSEIQAQLPASVVLVHYSVLADRVLIWTITASNERLIERAIAEPDLARLIREHRESIRAHRDRPATNRLYELLVDHLSSLPKDLVIVLVPDGQLQQLPFATLRHPTTGRYLVEDHALLVSPSASFFVDARAMAMRRGDEPLWSALLVGNPTAGGASALPGAEAEVEAAAKLYRRHELLVGRAATKERFLERAVAFEVVHFGGHAIANPEFPLLSRLVFADQAGGEQSLLARDIGRVRFPKTRVVVLAACSTAAGAISRGEGAVSVARPFLAGGVPLVVASQWDVDDRATEQLTLAFHRELAKSHNPVHALQAAQLALLRSRDAVLALPESWGAFVAIGTAAP